MEVSSYVNTASSMFFCTAAALSTFAGYGGVSTQVTAYIACAVCGFTEVSRLILLCRTFMRAVPFPCMAAARFVARSGHVRGAYKLEKI